MRVCDFMYVCVYVCAHLRVSFDGVNITQKCSDQILMTNLVVATWFCYAMII